MSQHPFPPQPPYYPQPPLGYSHYAPAAVADLLAPARRASVLQGILGGLTLMCGVLIGAFPHFANAPELFAASGQEMPPLPPGWTMEGALQLAFGVFGGCGLVLGIAMLVLAVFVRRGSRGAAITSIVVTGLVMIMLAIRLIATIVQVFGNPLAVLDVLVGAMAVGLFGLNLTWLMAAARNSTAVGAAAQQYQAQFYAYQHQQQAYGQVAYPPQPPQGAGAYGYGYAPPAATSGYAAPAPPQQPPQLPTQQPVSETPSETTGDRLRPMDGGDPHDPPR